MKNSHIPTVRHPFMMAGDALLVVLIPIPDICVNSLYRTPPERNQGTEIFCLRHAVLISSRFSTNESRIKRLCYRLWLFHLHSAMKIRPFLRFSPWRDPRPRHFSGYPFGVSRKKASAIFYDTAYIIPRVFPRRKGRPVPRSVFSSCSIRRNPAALRRTPWARPCAASRWPLGKCMAGTTRPNSIPTAPSAPCPLWRAASCSADKGETFMLDLLLTNARIVDGMATPGAKAASACATGASQP